MKLAKAKVLLTGGSSGIGKATAEILITNGAQVCITGRDKEKLDKVANELGCKAIYMDMSKPDQFGEGVADAVAQMKGINVLINNAGIGQFNLLENLSIQEFESVFQTNVFGLSLLTQEVHKYFKAQKEGTIVNIGSSAATKGFAQGSVYAASKFAVRGLTQCWQAEMRKDNIRVMLVNPSEVTTAFNNESREERAEVSNKLTPLEIAEVIANNIAMNNRGFVTETNVWATNPF